MKMIPGLAVACVLLTGIVGSGSTNLNVLDDDPRLFMSGGVLEFEGQPFMGTREGRAEDGAVVERMPFRDGFRHGVARAWYANGVPRYERRYVEGDEDGLHRGWYLTGGLKFEFRFEDGLLSGLAREWFEDGILFKEFRYVLGHEDGLQRMWYEDGELRANYVVMDGRRYGRIGAKGCVSFIDVGAET